MQAFATFESGMTGRSMDLPVTNSLGTESLLRVTRAGVYHLAPVFQVVDAALNLADVPRARNWLSTCGAPGRMVLKGSSR